MYIPGSIIDDWREAARSAGVSVSPFNLVAAWVHMVRAGVWWTKLVAENEHWLTSM